MIPLTLLAVYPQQSLRLIKDPVRGVFVPLIVLSYATIIIGTVNYAHPNHVSDEFIYVMFWYVFCSDGCAPKMTTDKPPYRVYVAFALVVCFPMLMIWFNNPHDLTTFTPAWAFLIFPMVRRLPLCIIITAR